MLQERVTELLDRYESGDEIMTARDVASELQEIANDEPYVHGLTDDLQYAIDLYAFSWCMNGLYGGHCDNGADRFIIRVKTYVDYKD